MAVPQFLLNYESKVNRELDEKGLNAQFQITDYNPNTKAVFYNLLSKNANGEIPKEANSIVEEALRDLRQFLYMEDRGFYSINASKQILEGISQLVAWLKEKIKIKRKDNNNPLRSKNSS